MLKDQKSSVMMWRSALVAAAGTLLTSGAVARPAIETINATMGADYLTKQATGFWYANMDHSGQYRGYAPDLGSDYDYPVYKAVSPGDGAALQRAINAVTISRASGSQRMARSATRPGSRPSHG